MRTIKQFLKYIRIVIGGGLLILFSNLLTAQQNPKRASFIEKINTAYTNQNITPSDSVFNALREEAWSLKEDSLYLKLTFEQIKKNRQTIDFLLVTNVLEDLMVKKYEYLKEHPKLLLLCYLNMGKFFLSQHNKSKASIEFSNYYFKYYFALLKTISLNEIDSIAHQNHRINYLEKTKNDSLFYYLNVYNIPKQEESLVLSKWYRSKKDYPKELLYAKTSSDSLSLFVAYKNNLKLKEVDILYPVLLEKFKEKNLMNEHVLYLNMGHRYALGRNFTSAHKMYIKALNFFENNKTPHLLKECLEAIIDLKIKNDDIKAYKRYNEKLNTLIENQQKEQLIVIRKYLSFVKNVTELEIKTKKKADNLEIIQAKNDIKYQKTITSIGLAFFLVFSVFIFFYFQSIKEREYLEYKNEKMKVNILKSKFKPHFTFNALSVINYFIAKEDVENASNALTKMASLLRSTLDNMNKDLVSYQSEYTICKNYMYLELLRFSDRFDCNFEALNDPVMKEWQLPPGIIEPFLENCVNHAFKGVKTRGVISLNHHIENNCLTICVKDNGIGIDTEKIYSENLHGLKITKEVIKTTSNLYKNPINIEIKTDGGTLVKLIIPLLKS